VTEMWTGNREQRGAAKRWAGDEPFEAECDACGVVMTVTEDQKTHEHYVYAIHCAACGEDGFLVSVPSWATEG
jgi:hypothetical protein